jgi:Rieske Fe-S protein
VSDATDQQQPATPDGFDRRTLLMRVGVVGAGAAGVLILSACGGAEEAATKATGAAGSATDAIKNAIKTADIPVGGGRVFPGLGVVVTQPEAEVFKAFSSRCSHMGNPIGSVSDGTINRPSHGSKFDIATGEVRNGPATRALPAKSVTVGSDGLSVS